MGKRKTNPKIPIAYDVCPDCVYEWHKNGVRYTVSGKKFYDGDDEPFICECCNEYTEETVKCVVMVDMF